MDRTAHLGELDRRLAATQLGVELGAILGPPVAAIIGEAPGPNTHRKLALFPTPVRSAGGRLFAYSKLTAAEYLGRFARRNLYSAIVPWSRFEAESRAYEVLTWLRRSMPTVRRVVLLGGRVGAAFGLGEPWSSRSEGGTSDGLMLIVIPHPSGRNRVYNDPAARARAGAEIRWAARKRRTRP